MPAAPYLIAMCDVLGFTRLVATTPLDEIHERYRALLAQLEPHPLFRIKAGTYAREIVLNRVVFSDTILMITVSARRVIALPSDCEFDECPSGLARRVPHEAGRDRRDFRTFGTLGPAPDARDCSFAHRACTVHVITCRRR